MTKGVYVLVLNNGKRYVGSSENVEKRVSDHKHGKGAAYTKRHGIVGQDVVITTQDGTIESWEQNETLAQMIKHGVHNVRGFQWVTDDLSPNDANVIKTLMCGLFSLCNHCGRPGHFGADCPDPCSKAQWMVEVCSISEPKNNKDAISELIRQSSVSPSTAPKPRPKPVQNTVRNHREIAPTGRAKCKECGFAISKGEYRVGEETTYKGRQCIKWFHEHCYAQKNSSVPTIQTPDKEPEGYDAKTDLLSLKAWLAVMSASTHQGQDPSGCSRPPQGWGSVMAKCMKCSKNGVLPHVDVCMLCGKSKHPSQTFHAWFTSEYEKYRTRKLAPRKTATSTCKKCGRGGHDSKTCYAKKHIDGFYIEDPTPSAKDTRRSPFRRAAMATYSESDSDDEDICYRCGRAGHWASECYAKKHVDGGYIRD